MSNANAPKVLYHYCSLSAFTSITSSKEIRLTDLSKSNDYLEGTWLFDAIDASLLSLNSQLPQFLADVPYEPLQHSIEVLQNLISESRKHINDARKRQRENDAFYGFCLSEKADLLSQWRGYADDGQGVAIGFSKDFFQSLCDASPDNLFISFKPVSYSVTPMQNLVADKIASLLVGDSNESSLADAFSELKLTSESIFYKNGAFEEEKEWRLVFRDQRNRGAGSDSLHRFGKATISTRKWYARENKLIPYHVLDYKDVPDAIQSIVIGPKCLIADDDMRNYLDDTGYDSKKIAIERSSSSYR